MAFKRRRKIGLIQGKIQCEVFQNAFIFKILFIYFLEHTEEENAPHEQGSGKPLIL